MLNIYLGDKEDTIFYPPTYFDNTYEDEWITDPLSVEMIKDIDKSVVVSSHLIDSPVLGPIPPVNLSGGVKTLSLWHSIRIIGYLMPPVATIVQNGSCKLLLKKI